MMAEIGKFLEDCLLYFVVVKSNRYKIYNFLASHSNEHFFFRPALSCLQLIFIYFFFFMATPFNTFYLGCIRYIRLFYVLNSFLDLCEIIIRPRYYT